MSKALEKKPHTSKDGLFEELLPEEEAAIEEGRKAYARGEWVSFNNVKNGVGSSRYKTGAKKS